MSTILTPRRVVNPTRRTTVLFDATKRHPARRDFGRGLLRSVPTYRTGYTADDAALVADFLHRRGVESAEPLASNETSENAEAKPASKETEA